MDIVETILDETELVTEEYDYEETAPVVFEVKGKWLKLKLRSGVFVWLAPQDAGKIHSYRELAGEGSFIRLLRMRRAKRRIEITTKQVGVFMLSHAMA